LESADNLADLLATVLLGGVRRLVRQGLVQEYVTKEEAIAGVRGRIDLSVTARKLLMAHGKAFCSFDELEVNVLPNQILKSTVRRLSLVTSLDGDLKRQLLVLDRELQGIDNIPLSSNLFRLIQLHRNSGLYKFLLSVCELVLDLSIPTERSGRFAFRDFFRDDKAMASLFEAFIFNFLKRERADLRVTREDILWKAKSTSDPKLVYLPRMKTDVSIRNRPHTRTLIMDAKFYRETFQSNYDTQKLHSAHLYQLFAYLSNLGDSGPDIRAQAMLVYPTVTEEFDLDYELDGRVIRVCTLNLDVEWQRIRSRLLGLVDRVVFSQEA